MFDKLLHRLCSFSTHRAAVYFLGLRPALTQIAPEKPIVVGFSKPKALHWDVETKLDSQSTSDTSHSYDISRHRGTSRFPDAAHVGVFVATSSFAFVVLLVQRHRSKFASWYADSFACRSLVVSGAITDRRTRNPQNAAASRAWLCLSSIRMARG